MKGDSTVISTDTVGPNTLLVKIDNVGNSRLFRATYLGLPLIAGGLLEKQFDNKFRRLRNDFMPRFHRTLDNYTQFAPAAVMVGLKAAGVPSRSSWGRMLVSDAFSTACVQEA